MRKSLWVVACCILSLSVAARQEPVPTTQPADAGGDNEMLKQLLTDLKDKKPQQTDQGYGTVAAKRAALCPICLQPLYKHSENNFDCRPLDKDGKPKIIPEIKRQPVNCPVCGETFSGALRTEKLDDSGGTDRDFCIHSVGKFNVHSKVWMCPDCGYAALIDGFGRNLDGSPVGDNVKTFVNEKLRADTRKKMISIAGIQAKSEAEIPADLKRFSRYVEQPEIPDWLKYDHALQILELTKPPHSLQATMYLDAAHACRREVCSELAVPGLHNSLQVSLGQSIRRVNSFLASQCMTIRRKRGEPVADPTKPDLDQKIVAQAALELIKIGEDISRAQNSNQAAAERNGDNYLRVGDMYVLYARLAGAYDRIGRLDDALKALEKSRNFIPDKMSVNVDNVENKELEAYFQRQLTLMRNVINDRMVCVTREKEYLFNAGRSNLAALKFKEVPLREAGKPGPADGSPAYDPAPTGYLLGEVFRRADAQAEAGIFYGVADRVLARYIKIADDDSAKLGNQINEANKDRFAEIDARRNRWNKLKDWNDEQRGQIKAKGAPDDYVKGVANQLLVAAGLDAEALLNVAPPTLKEAKPDQSMKPLPAGEPKANAGSAMIKTREALYRMYDAAMKKYRKEKNENPPSLAELVKGGYVPADDSCLDNNGKLFCPETQERLMYVRVWQPGDKDAPVIFPLKAGTATLFADGTIRTGLVKK